MADPLKEILACYPRSPENLASMIDALNPKGNQRYQREVIAGALRTKCNWFDQDLCMAMGCPIPKLQANDIIVWLRKGPQGWAKCSLTEGKRAAGRGEVVLPVWFNPKGHPGHMGVLRDIAGRMAQAGRTNFNSGLLSAGFGKRKIEFFHHP